MLPKPDSCVGCPLYGNGRGFVPDEIVDGAEVMVVGQNPGEQEEAQGRPFVGATGKVMEQGFFPLAGLERGKVSIGNAIRCRWKKSNLLPPLGTAAKVAEQALAHCKQAHLRIPESTRLVVAQGDYALTSLTGERGITGWRGWLVPQLRAGSPRHTLTEVYEPTKGARGPEAPVLTVMHLASLFHDPALRIPMQADWRKVARFLAGTWPLRVPPIDTDPPKKWPPVCAFDTEYQPDGVCPGQDKLIRVSLATPNRHVYVVEARDVLRYKYRLTSPVQVLMQNAPSDLGFLSDLVDLNKVREEDTMLAHSVLWQGASDSDDEAGSKARGLPHSLDFLASLYGSVNRTKHLSVLNPIVYSGMDALLTLDSWRGIYGELERDPESKWIYEHCVRPLARIIWRARQHGLLVNQDRVTSVVKELKVRTQEATLQAQAAVGWPINLGSSQQVSNWLFNIEGLKAPRTRR